MANPLDLRGLGAGQRLTAHDIQDYADQLNARRFMGQHWFVNSRKAPSGETERYLDSRPPWA